MNVLNNQTKMNGSSQGPSTSSASMSSLLPQPFNEDESLINEYMFESDHAALKGNEDYQNLLNDLVMFEAKRIQALKDMNTLIEIEEKALEEPISFVNKLQNCVDIGIPKPIDIPQPLLIDWDKYTSVPEHLIGLNRRLSMRKLCGKLENTVGETVSDADSVHHDEDSNHSAPVVIRGRVKDENKCETFNQLWTVDEQKRLEELLMKHPPEEVEMKRYQKIATALGNRTTIQVQSRIQKYFIKLAKAGLPIPGRIPRAERNYKTGTAGGQHASRDRYYLQPSTFMQSHQPPVYMSDDEDDVTPKYRGKIDDVSDEEDVPEEWRSSDEYRELMRLKRLRNHTQIQRLGDVTGPEHSGYKCDRCEMNPIQGTRWNCQDCPPDVSVDLCSFCADSVFETSSHDSRHRLVPVHTPLPQSHIDKDYLRFAPPSGYNYLDPNYMPAT